VTKAMILLISLIGGALVAVGAIWLFDIDVASWEKLQAFPEGWNFRDLVFNGAALMLAAGAVKGLYMGLNEYVDGVAELRAGDDDGPKEGDR